MPLWRPTSTVTSRHLADPKYKNPKGFRRTCSSCILGVCQSLDLFRFPESASQGLDFLHRRGPHANAPRPDLIYLDLEMPGISGQQVLEAAKSDPQLRDIPIVMMTGVTDEDHIARAIRGGANCYIVKPNDPETFMRFIARATNYWLCVHQDRPA